MASHGRRPARPSHAWACAAHHRKRFDNPRLIKTIHLERCRKIPAQCVRGTPGTLGQCGRAVALLRTTTPRLLPPMVWDGAPKRRHAPAPSEAWTVTLPQRLRMGRGVSKRGQTFDPASHRQDCGARGASRRGGRNRSGRREVGRLGRRWPRRRLRPSRVGRAVAEHTEPDRTATRRGWPPVPWRVAGEFCGVEQRQLAWLITTRTGVRVPPPQPSVASSSDLPWPATRDRVRAGRPQPDTPQRGGPVAARMLRGRLGREGATSPVPYIPRTRGGGMRAAPHQCHRLG